MAALSSVDNEVQGFAESEAAATYFTGQWTCGRSELDASFYTFNIGIFNLNTYMNFQFLHFILILKDAFRTRNLDLATHIAKRKAASFSKT
jgi:hypothetical protein